MPKITVVDMNLAAVQDQHAAEPGAETFKVEADEVHLAVGAGADDNAVGTGYEHPGFDVNRLDCDRFGDRDGTKAAGIKYIDLATRSCLADRPRECLAGRG